MYKKFKVDNVTYCVDFSNDEFSFYVDLVDSNEYLPKADYDPFEKFDPNAEIPTTDYGRVATKSVFKVKRGVLGFIKEIIEKKAPYYFYFEVVDVDKLNIYESLGKRLCWDYPYTLSIEAIDGVVYLRFYKTGI